MSTAIAEKAPSKSKTITRSIHQDPRWIAANEKLLELQGHQARVEADVVADLNRSSEGRRLSRVEEAIAAFQAKEQPAKWHAGNRDDLALAIQNARAEVERAARLASKDISASTRDRQAARIQQLDRLLGEMIALGREMTRERDALEAEGAQIDPADWPTVEPNRLQRMRDTLAEDTKLFHAEGARITFSG